MADGVLRIGERHEHPGVRRIRLDSTGWVLLCEAAADLGLPTEQLPLTDLPTQQRDTVRDALVAGSVLTETGELAPVVRGALALLTTAPIAITVETLRSDRTAVARWRTLGVPTAGVAIAEHRVGDQLHREIELTMLTSDDLVAAIIDQLLGDDPDPGASTASLDEQRGSFELATDDVDGVPPGVIDGQGDVVARAAVGIEGPAGTTIAQLLGDGHRWWQVGAVAPDRLRWELLDPAALRAVLIDALAAQFATAPGGDDA